MANPQDKPVKKRNVTVIALSIICIVLAASLISVLAFYQPTGLQSQLKQKDQTISSLQTEIQVLQNSIISLQNSSYGGNTAQIEALNAQVSYLNETLTSIYSGYTNLQAITELQKSGVMYNNAVSLNPNTTQTIWDSPIDYAGFITVQTSDTSNSTTAEVIYNYDVFNVDSLQYLGNAGTVMFPVLPGPNNVQVIIANKNPTTIINGTITATYVY